MIRRLLWTLMLVLLGLWLLPASDAYVRTTDQRQAPLLGPPRGHAHGSHVCHGSRRVLYLSGGGGRAGLERYRCSIYV